MSGVHYGHYKAAIQDPQSTNSLALQLTIIARSRIPPESWSIGLQVMLEKIVGVYIVTVCPWTDHILARNPLLEVEADIS